MRERIDIGDAVENGFFAAAVGGDNGFAEAVEAELEQTLENYVDGRGDGTLDVKALDDLQGLGGIGRAVGWRIFHGANAFEEDEFAVIFFDVFCDGGHLFIEVGGGVERFEALDRDAASDDRERGRDCAGAGAGELRGDRAAGDEACGGCSDGLFLRAGGWGGAEVC